MDNLDNPDNHPYPNQNEILISFDHCDIPMSPNCELPMSPNHNEFPVSLNLIDHPTPDPDPPPPQSVPPLPPEITHIFHPTINGKFSLL